MTNLQHGLMVTKYVYHVNLTILTPEIKRKNWVSIIPMGNIFTDIKNEILYECDIIVEDEDYKDYIVSIDIYDLSSVAYREDRQFNIFEAFDDEYKNWQSENDMYASFLRFCDRLRVTYINHDRLKMIAEGSNTYTSLYDAIYTRKFKYKIGDHVRIRYISNDGNSVMISNNVYEIVEEAPGFEDFALKLSGEFGYSLKCVSKNPSENEPLKYTYEALISEDQLVLV